MVRKQKSFTVNNAEIVQEGNIMPEMSKKCMETHRELEFIIENLEFMNEALDENHRQVVKEAAELRKELTALRNSFRLKRGDEMKKIWVLGKEDIKTQKLGDNFSILPSEDEEIILSRYAALELWRDLGIWLEAEGEIDTCPRIQMGD